MSYRTIVVELQADRFPAARLTAARALAQRFGASLVGMHVMPPPFWLGIVFERRSIVQNPSIVDPKHFARTQRKLDP